MSGSVWKERLEGIGKSGGTRDCNQNTLCKKKVCSIEGIEGKREKEYQGFLLAFC